MSKITPYHTSPIPPYNPTTPQHQVERDKKRSKRDESLEDDWFDEVEKFFVDFNKNMNLWSNYWLLAAMRREIGYISALWRECREEFNVHVSGDPVTVTDFDVEKVFTSEYGSSSMAKENTPNQPHPPNQTPPKAKKPSASARILRSQLKEVMSECSKFLEDHANTSWIITVIFMNSYRQASLVFVLFFQFPISNSANI